MPRAEEGDGVIPTKVIEICPVLKFETEARNHAARKG